MNGRWIIAAAILAGVSPAGSALGVQQQVSRSGPVAADVTVEVFNIVGTVRVTGWDRDEIQVQGTLGQGVEGLAFENDHDVVEIRVEIPGRRRRDTGRQVGDTHLEIMVPRGASLEIETLAASIAVDGVDGDVRMESSAGGITYTGGATRVEAGTAAGDIEVNASAAGADIDVEGVAGSVLVQFISGNVAAGSLTGNVRVIGGRIGEGSFESVSGTLYFEGEIGAGAELDFDNFNGDIELLIPADSAAEFDISTHLGSIETEFGFEGRSVEQYSPEQEAEFTLAGGGAEVSIETFSGNVTVRRQ
jgi:DUF4097 and DUF4098 domain-containing protein YvlB